MYFFSVRFFVVGMEGEIIAIHDSYSAAVGSGVVQCVSLLPPPTSLTPPTTLWGRYDHWRHRSRESWRRHRLHGGVHFLLVSVTDSFLLFVVRWRVFVITESKFIDRDGRVIKTIGRVTERGVVRYAATGLTQRVRDKCDACRVDCISRVRHLVGCLALTDK